MGWQFYASAVLGAALPIIMITIIITAHRKDPS